METKICFFVNEKSNSSRAGYFIRESEAQILNEFPQAEIWYISNLSELDSKAEEASKQFDLIVACGGDGTILSVANSVYFEQKVLAIIPLGSGNDFAKSIQLLPKKPIFYYINVLKEKITLDVDFPTINDEHFLNIVGIGFDGLTNKYAQQFKWIRGRLKYTLAGIKAFCFAKPFHASLRFNQTEISDMFWMIALANGRVEGGIFEVSPNSNNTDGKVELVLFRNYNRIILIIQFTKLSFGFKISPKYRKIVAVNQADISFKKPQYAHADGENKKRFQHCYLKVSSQKIKVVIPSNYNS